MRSYDRTPAAEEPRLTSRGGKPHADAASGSGACTTLPPINGTPRLRESHGLRSTDVTTKQNCAGLQWFQQASDDESPEKLNRRLQFAAAEQTPRPARPTSLGGFAGLVEWSTESRAYGSGLSGLGSPKVGSARGGATADSARSAAEDGVSVVGSRAPNPGGACSSAKQGAAEQGTVE